jgi:hypothetical protein
MSDVPEHRLLQFSGEQPSWTPDVVPERPERSEEPPPGRPRPRSYDPNAEQENRTGDLAAADSLLDDADPPDFGKQLAEKRGALINFGNVDKVSDAEVVAMKELVKDILGWEGDQRAIQITLNVSVSKDGSAAHIVVLDAKTDRKVGFLDITFDKNDLQAFETVRQFQLAALNKHIRTLNNYTTTATDDEVDALKGTIKDVLGWKGDARDVPLSCRVSRAKDGSAYSIVVENKTTREWITTIDLTRDTDSGRFTDGAIQKPLKRPAQ